MAQDNQALNLAIIGCGRLGTSVLIGLYQGQCQVQHSRPIRVSVTVKSLESVERLTRVVNQLKADSNTNGHNKCEISVHLQDFNATAISKADIVVLICKPSAYERICRDWLTESAHDTSNRRLWVSLIGGTPCSKIEKALRGSTGELSNLLTIVRAIPNVAAQIRQSITTLALPEVHEYSSDQASRAISMATELFNLVGTTMWVPEMAMDTTSTIGASSVAFFAKIIDHVVRGAEADGENLPSNTLLSIVAQAAYGSAGLILHGMASDTIIDQVATRGGSTQAGLDALEMHGTAVAIRTAVNTTIITTQQLGDRHPKA